MKSNLTQTILLVAACTILTACGPAKLRTIVNDFNRQCPVSLGAMGVMDSASYNASTVTLYYTVDGEYMNFDMIRENEQLFHDNMLESYSNNQEEGFKMLIDAIVDADAAMEVVLRTSDGDSLTAHFTADEIKNNRPGANSDPLALLQAIVDNTRLQLPMNIGSGITFVDATLDDNYFTYVYECDEDSVDMDILQDEFTNNREQTIADIDVTEPSMLRLLKLLKSANRGYAMKYIGKSSGKTATLFIEPEEL